tara:strand:- start:441 stop:839 length:399 start_codon:yes stop_codon:yes gene_type:complete
MKEFYTWEDIENLVSVLCHKLKDVSFDSIYGVSRGGLIPAVMISHRLGVPLRTSLESAYIEKVLVVDDIADTGRTLEQLKRLEVFKNSMFATLDYHRQSVVEPDFWVNEKGDKWIVYPWERNDSEEIQDYLV